MKFVWPPQQRMRRDSMASVGTRSRRTWIFGRALVTAAALCAALSCGGGSSSPASPSTPQAVVTISAFNVSVSVSGTTRTFRTSFTMTETSGRTAANVTQIRFAFPGTSRSANADPSAPVRIAPGGSTSSGTINLTDDTGTLNAVTSVNVTVAWSDDSGRTSSATSNATFSQPAPEPVARNFTLAGVISDLSGRPVSAATVAATDGTNTRRTSTTDGNGYYSIAPLREGSVTVIVTATGYQSLNRTVTLTGDLRLELLIAPNSAPPPTQLSCGAPAIVTCINGGHQGTPTARCTDGAWSCSTTASGTCSGHGGIACRVCPGPLC